MRITRIEIRDFRGFPGPGTYVFDLDGGKNLLVYGENGSGTSTLFRALVEFFNLDPRAKPFVDYKNIFSDSTLQDGHVTVHFDDGQPPAVWSCAGDRPTRETRVAETAQRKGCLDYRSLLQTNFIHGIGPVNLFELVVEALLAHYPLVAEGPTVTVGKLWLDILNNLPTSHHRRRLEMLNTAITRFNQAVDPVWTELQTKAEDILKTFPGCGVSLQFDFPGVSYDTGERTLTQKQLHLSVAFNGRPILEHQHFLNEARLSAIALSLYFAGLLISIPPAVPGAPEYPRLLVLDDVLIGLDMSNRLPVLDILHEHFADWQIILLTHDRVWYEIVRLQTEASRNWFYHELYYATTDTGYECPIHRGHNEGWPDLLKRARQHLHDNDERAAAVYARAAFEQKLQRYCERNAVPVRYHTDPRRMDAQWFWDAIKRKLRDEGKLATYQSIISRIETFRKIVLNPLSHANTTTVTRAEIQGAIDTVDTLNLGT
jgi:energy-coupling factor transporter ATP-binding protein EcfA2